MCVCEGSGLVCLVLSVATMVCKSEGGEFPGLTAKYLWKPTCVGPAWSSSAGGGWSGNLSARVASDGVWFSSSISVPLPTCNQHHSHFCQASRRRFLAYNVMWCTHLSAFCKWQKVRQRATWRQIQPHPVGKMWGCASFFATFAKASFCFTLKSIFQSLALLERHLLRL